MKQPFTPAYDVKLGEGDEAVVTLRDRTTVAVKRFHKIAVSKERYCAELEVVSRLMKIDQSAPLWPFYYLDKCGCYAGVYTLVLEKLQPLKSWLTRARNFPALCTEDTVIAFQNDVSTGLTRIFLHAGVCHCDVKPGNILVRQTKGHFNFILTDWGRFSYRGSLLANSLAGSMAFIDPALVRGNTESEQLNWTQHDQYSLGLCVCDVYHRFGLDDFFSKAWTAFLRRKRMLRGALDLGALLSAKRRLSIGSEFADFEKISPETDAFVLRVAQELLRYNPNASQGRAAQIQRIVTLLENENMDLDRIERLILSEVGKSQHVLKVKLEKEG